MSDKKVIRLCRTCLTSTEHVTELFNMYDIDGETLQMSEIVEICTGLAISWEDNLPDNICKDCVSKLCKSFAFRKQCRDADKILRDQTGIIMEDEDEEEEASNVKVEALEEDDTGTTTTYYIDTNVDAEIDYLYEEVGEETEVKIDDNTELLEVLEDVDETIAKTDESVEEANILPKPKKPDSKSKTGTLLCSECGKVCNSKTLLLQHIRLHNPDKCSKCKICNKLFSAPSMLLIHMKKHTGEKPFACEVCGYKWSNKFDLAVHMRIHTGEKPYKCDQCGKESRTSSHHREHIRRHHQKPAYHCVICKKSYKQKYVLEEHIRSHDPENHYSCDLCDRKYLTRKNLRKHRYSHFGSFFPCEYCGKRFLEEPVRDNHVLTHKKLTDIMIVEETESDQQHLEEVTEEENVEIGEVSELVEEEIV